MEEEEWERRLTQGCRKLGVHLSPQQIESFRVYRHQLQTWNPSAGLVSRGDEPRLVERHFLDSLALLQVLDFPGTARVLDVGTGGGFPGLPLKICRPRIEMTLLEPKEKSWHFLKDLLRALRLEGVSLVRQRAQEAAGGSEFPGRFDCVLVRALAPLDRLVPLCLPFARPGGLLAAYKGPRVREEMDRARGAIQEAGADSAAALQVPVPGLAEPRYVVVVSRP
jgi:16S rRNA (guanine527-N7)-methyltransferase